MRYLALSALLLVLAGCAKDEDGDGFSVTDDCNDADAAVNPSAVEVCNGLDDDCDGLIDDADDAVDVSTGTAWFDDVDGDGFGDPVTETMACAASAGQVADATDCDDAAGDVNPAATEVCNDIDDDCDGLVDDADDGLDTSTADTWYDDSDGDGYGDPAAQSLACDQPAGAVADDTDCDDGAGLVNPAATEVCNDIDDDCDGLTDDDDDSVDLATGYTWYGDGDGDGFGDVADPQTACDQPAGTADDATDCDDGADGVNPAATEVCNDIDDDCDGDVDDDDAGVDLATGETWYADTDSDGYGDPDVDTLACDQPSGYVGDDTDCDDDDEDINVAATEVCDDVDNDCDGDIDDDDSGLDTSTADTWYADGDTDGYGDPDDTTLACEQPSGYVADDTDCDDSDKTINTAATEVCDDADNDCNGDIDDDDAGLDTTTADTWYADTDGDDYGDADVTTLACDVPSGYVADDTDCDDDDDTTYPGATEVPQDGVDQDCDGSDAPYSVDDLVAGDLVITEFMQNPAAVSDANGEWFEVFNNSGGVVDLDGLYVYDAGSDSFSVSGETLVDDGDYAVFGRSDDTSVNGGAPVDYAYGSSFTLGNADDEIYLAESSAIATVFDGVAYDDGATFPDGNGTSASLDPESYDGTENDDGDNWCDPESSYGDGDLGTPGADNDDCVVVTFNVGNDATFSTTGAFAANYLLGTTISIPDDMTVTAFGLISAGTGAVQMALYTDGGSGPDTLVAYTGTETVATGGNEYAITEVAVTAGTYYLMAVYAGTTTNYYNASSSKTVYYKSFTYGGTLPSTFTGGLTFSGQDYNYYLVGY